MNPSYARGPPSSLHVFRRRVQVPANEEIRGKGGLVLERACGGAHVFANGGILPDGLLGWGGVAPGTEDRAEDVWRRGWVADSKDLAEGGFGKAKLAAEGRCDFVRVGGHAVFGSQGVRAYRYCGESGAVTGSGRDRAYG